VMKYIKLSRTRTLPDAVSFFGNRINILPALRVRPPTPQHIVSERTVTDMSSLSPTPRKIPTTGSCASSNRFREILLGR
jgi:hypothetical protein